MMSGMMQCKIYGCEREQNAPLCREHRQQFGGFRRARTPTEQLAYMQALCRIHPLTGCWEPMSGGLRKGGYINVSYANVCEAGHRIVMRLTARNCWPIYPLVVVHSPLCEYAYRRGLMRARCWNPGHLTIDTQQENHKTIHIVNRLLIRYATGETDEQIIAASKEQYDL